MKRFFIFLSVSIVVALLIVPASTRAVEDTEPEINTETEQPQETVLQAESDTDLDIDNEEPDRLSENTRERTEFPVSVQRRIDMIRNNINERRGQQTGVRVQEKVKLQLEASLDTTINQFEAAIQQLTDFSERLEIRLIRMEERGHDVSAAFDVLELAQAEIEASAEAIAKTAVSAVETISSETPRARQLVVRTSLADARSSLRDARESLFRVITAARTPINTPEQKETNPKL